MPSCCCPGQWINTIRFNFKPHKCLGRIWEVGITHQSKSSLTLNQTRKTKQQQGRVKEMPKKVLVCSLPNRGLVNYAMYIFYELLIWSFDKYNYVCTVSASVKKAETSTTQILLSIYLHHGQTKQRGSFLSGNFCNFVLACTTCCTF